jgi:hypothetical protein
VSVELFIKAQHITRRQSTCRPYAWKCVNKFAIAVSVGPIRSAGCFGLNIVVLAESYTAICIITNSELNCPVSNGNKAFRVQLL